MTTKDYEIVAYYNIRKDSDQIKRVEELAIKRDVAESVGNTDEIQIIDSELSNIGDTNAKL
mgnify:CR=1 FL=1